MLVTKRIEIRLYPNKSQANFINKMVGATRVVYNSILYRKQKYYEETGKYLNILYTDLYYEFPWLKELDSRAICQVGRDVEVAYSNFFKSISEHNSNFNKPVYKKKRNYGNYRIPIPAKHLFSDSSIYLPKIKLVKYRGKIDFLKIRKIRNLIVKKTNSGKYFCSICCDFDQNDFEYTGKKIGLDLGIKDLIITSDGDKFENKHFQRNKEKQIKHLQRKLSHKIKGSKNYEKTRLKLATAYEKLRNKRKDYLQKLTTNIIKTNDIICIEDLNVKAMCKNHKLAAALSDSSFYRIRRMIKYKCEWYGRKFIVVDRWFASSKICHSCGYKNKSMTLSVREWVCPSCGTQHDRDINAAINIRDFSIRNVNTDGISEFQACGEKSSVSRNRKRSFSVNQEENISIHKMTTAKRSS